MRKVIFLMHVSLDGFVAGPNGEMDWIIYDDEVEKYSHDLHDQTDAAIYGRVTFQMMEGYWPTVLTNPESTQAERNHATWLDDATKIVLSRTLDKVEWQNTLFLSENIAEEMTKIKQQPGKNLWLLGSPSVAQLFMQHGLIDEYRLNINPVILGQGKPLFAGLQEKLQLQLVETIMFKCGVVALRYVPV